MDHAIRCDGLSRQTVDIDLLVDRAFKNEWSVVLTELDCRAGQDDHRFARFRSVHLAAWPIALMYVDADTFSAMCSEAHEFERGVWSQERVTK